MHQATVHSTQGFRSEINVRNHTIYADEPADKGGADSAPTPMDMLVGALGACVVITLQMYAQRKGWPLEEVHVTVSLERYKKEDYPAYTGDSGFVNEVRQQITLVGPLTVEQKTRLLEIGTKCPVHKALEFPTFFIDELPEGAKTIEPAQ